MECSSNTLLANYRFTVRQNPTITPDSRIPSLFFFAFLFAAMMIVAQFPLADGWLALSLTFYWVLAAGWCLGKANKCAKDYVFNTISRDPFMIKPLYWVVSVVKNSIIAGWQQSACTPPFLRVGIDKTMR